LLALHAKQHLAMLSRFTMRASLTMCFYVAIDPRLAGDKAKSVPQ